MWEGGLGEMGDFRVMAGDGVAGDGGGGPAGTGRGGGGERAGSGGGGPRRRAGGVWGCLGESALGFLTGLCGGAMEGGIVLEGWGRRAGAYFWERGGVRSCGGCGGMGLIGRIVGLWERVVGRRLGCGLAFGDRRYGFVPGRGAADALFALRVLVGKCGKVRRGCVVCLWTWGGGARDKVPGVVLRGGSALAGGVWWRCGSGVVCGGGGGGFGVRVGLRRGSALGLCLFAVVMGGVADGIGGGSVDPGVCRRRCDLRRERGRRLGGWECALEGRDDGRREGRSACVCRGQGGGAVRVHGGEVVGVRDFECLGSAVQGNGECGGEGRGRAGGGWRGVGSGLLRGECRLG